MQLESRIRRQREFLTFMLEKFQPKCYWCDKPIDPKAFNLAGHEIDPLTIHHVDENHDNDVIENRVLIHKDCHQEMHKMSTAVGLPPMLIREAKMQKATK
jgi:hypothetical protein